jgi:aryl-alcohol dehydrogenase-like predicted oxidoreductase
MITRKIQSTGEDIAVVGLGTWQTFDVGKSPAERKPLEPIIAEFVALGGQLIDSSPMYGRAEEVVGDIVDHLGLRSKMFIATKVWTSGRDRGIDEMKSSMRKLRADPIDLIQVHNLVDVRTQLETLDAWKRDGVVRHTGVTHYTAGAHAEVARVIEAHPVDFLQINYSVAERDAEQRLLPLAKERGIAVIANRPFATGDLFQRLAGKAVPAWAAEIDCTSWSQLLLKFVLSHPAMTCAIPATSSVEHLRDNMKAGTGKMPDLELRLRIAAAFPR